MNLEFQTPEWLKHWQTKYADLLVNGLTDGPTYLRLATKETPTLVADLAFRPLSYRVSQNVILIGGKLAVFPRKDSLKAQPTSDHVMVGWLAATFPMFEFPKRSPARVGTILISAMKAPLDTKKETLSGLKEGKFAESLLEHIASTGTFQMEHGKRLQRALMEAYESMFDEMFDPEQEDAPLPDNVVQVEFKKASTTSDGTPES